MKKGQGHMNRTENLKRLEQQVARAESLKDESATYYTILETTPKNLWAIVSIYDAKHGVCSKVAYCSKKSIMHEYDVDWMLPFDEKTGDWWDTQVCGGLSRGECEWMLAQFEQMKKGGYIK